MRVAVQPEDEAHVGTAAALASRLGVPLLTVDAVAGPDRGAAASRGTASGPRREYELAFDVVLRVGAAGLALVETGSSAGAIQPDVALLGSPRPGRDDLLRAVGRGDPARLRVVDATGGMGADGFVLAAAGASVTLLERSPILAALLRDALRRARDDPATRPAADRVELREGDARHLLAKLEPPNVVYLDPMYPDLGKSAAKSKEMRLFRALVGDDPDAAELLRAARLAALQRVVVKRPARAPPLAGRPSGAIRGRSVRFDLYPPER